jgi:23S rRNA (guanosine2251-2'-O)-methyltransferase
VTTEIIYGVNPVMSALENDIKIKEVYLNERKFENEINEFHKKGIQVKPLSNFDFERFGLDENINVQGIVAVITPKSLLSVKELIIKAKKEEENPVIVIADKITDPHNVGAIIRNIAAFNTQGLIIGKHNQSSITPTVHKTSAGNVFNVNIAQTSSMSNAIKELKDEGF